VGLFLGSQDSVVGLLIGFFAVNFASSALSPALQTWLIRVAHRSEVLGASLNQAAFNVANALGAALGGAVIAAGFGYRAPMLVAIVLASLGFALVAGTLLALRVRSRRTLAVLREHEATYTGAIPVVVPDAAREAAREVPTRTDAIPVPVGS
ncbi:MFS transporter, partial [Brachybacterium sp. AOP42-C2-15]|uniref:MFS transporter n=1 Tax=Brachybacterium sp. AOP42-C2-15 TaxID=3457670 RepID=UPI004033316C